MFSFLRGGLEEVGARGHADENNSKKTDIPNINSSERDPVSAWVCVVSVLGIEGSVQFQDVTP